MKYSKECFWSILNISIYENNFQKSVIDECFQMVDDFEAKYSRFIHGNTLHNINIHKSATLPKEIISLLQLCLKVSKLTHGCFDITVQPVLENSGYGIEKWVLKENIWYQNIEINNNLVTLHNDVNIEFGSFGKWYIVDLLYNILLKHSQNFIINFWWDIRVAGTHDIYLEDPLDTTQAIGKISLSHTAIASSSWNKRKISKGHHLMNAKTRASQNDKIALYVTHKIGVFADIFSTALFVTPLEKALKLLDSIDWLEALIIASDGKVFKTNWFHARIDL